MEQRRNYTIDFMRLIMAMFIVALHSNPFAEYSALISYFPSQVLSRLGVPFFAAIAGYYFFRSDPNKKYQKTIQRYLQPYFLWSVIYFIYRFSQSEIGGGISKSINDTLMTFVFTGFYHLWYMLAIIYTVAIVWMASRYQQGVCTLYYITFICLLIGILMFGYGNLFFRFPLVKHTFGSLDPNINMQTQWIFSVIPFFMMGYGLSRSNVKNIWIYRKCELLLVIVLAAYFAEVMILQVFDFMRSTTLCLCTYPIVYLLIVVSLKHPDFVNAKIARYSAGIASFMYFGHILSVLIAQRIGIAQTPTYVIAVLLSTVIGGIIVKLDNQIMNKLI